MLVFQPLQRIKGPRSLNPRKAVDPNMQNRKKSKFCLPLGISWKRVSRSLSLENSATSPSDGYSLLICTVESHPAYLRGFQKTQGTSGLGGRHPFLQGSWDQIHTWQLPAAGLWQWKQDEGTGVSDCLKAKGILGLSQAGPLHDGR